MYIAEIDAATRAAVDALIKEEWAGPMIISKGEVIDTSQNPGFVCLESGELKGILTYLVRKKECEITVLTVLDEGKGIGTELIARVVERAKALGCTRVWLVTTNDNTHAIRFYQKRGFDLVAFHRNAMEISRKLKPAIPLTGIDDIPLLHEFEFEILL